MDANFRGARVAADRGRNRIRQGFVKEFGEVDMISGSGLGRRGPKQLKTWRRDAKTARC